MAERTALNDQRFRRSHHGVPRARSQEMHPNRGRHVLNLSDVDKLVRETPSGRKVFHSLIIMIKLVPLRETSSGLRITTLGYCLHVEPSPSVRSPTNARLSFKLLPMMVEKKVRSISTNRGYKPRDSAGKAGFHHLSCYPVAAGSDGRATPPTTSSREVGSLISSPVLTSAKIHEQSEYIGHHFR